MKEKILTILRKRDDYVSGQELCDGLGVSRTAVWKVINQLKTEGYVMEAVPNRGYRLVSTPDILSREELSSIRRTKWLGRDIYFYPEVTSTNTKARELADEGAAHGSLVVAEVQTQGRGRRGRQWSAPKGVGIWFSLILKPQIEPNCASMLTLVAAMAVAKGIGEVTNIRPSIKWPNDVVLSGKKVCGILTEMSAQIDYINHIVVGIGINVKRQDFPEEIAATATSVEAECGEKISRSQLLMAVLDAFERYYELYLQTMDVSLFQEEYNSFLANRDNQVKVLDPRGAYEGIARGVNEKGELLVEVDGRMTTVNSGEVSVRGIYGYV